MDDIVSSPPSPGTRKRPFDDCPEQNKNLLNLKGSQFIMPTPPDTDNSSDASPLANTNRSEEVRAASPAPSSSALSSAETVTTHSAEQSRATAISASPVDKSSHKESAKSGEPPKKRRKLTQAEKEEQKQHKESKEREKSEQKLRREEEKRVKEEEKKVKEEEKREEKRVKDGEKRRKAEEKEAKKREKELDEERRQQEKLKKERSQMRLGAFFQKPATPVKQPTNPEDQTLQEPTSTTRRRSLSLETFDNLAEELRQSISPCKKTPRASEKDACLQTLPDQIKPITSDYRRYFLPFAIPSHTRLAPATLKSEDDLLLQARFDRELRDPSLREKYDLGIERSYASLQEHFLRDCPSPDNLFPMTIREVMDRIHGSSQKPIDLTSNEAAGQPIDLLRQVPMRYLHFCEDVRPPYFGTYTKIRSPVRSQKLRRNPFIRTRKDTDYDVDSEAEWEEPEEGEDILDDEDDEAESLGDADEMDEFLDDENDELQNRRKMVTSDLEPLSTGLCWEDDRNKILPNPEGGNLRPDLGAMRMDVLLPGLVKGRPIDPFSTAYWDPEPTQTAAVPAATGWPFAITSNGMQQPTRPPLQQLPSGNRVATVQTQLIGASEGEKGPITSASVANSQAKKAGRKPAPKSLSDQELAEFKDAVVGSQLGKADLLKGLKLRFKKMTNETIKETLSTHFAQIGSTKADKKWVFVSIATQ